MSSPTVNDIELEDSQRIGERIRDLEVGDGVKVTNNRMDDYVYGNVVEKIDEMNDEEFYHAIVEDLGGDRWELHVNWRDIPPDSEDQETPYTGLIEAPADDTAPAVTDLVVNE